MKYITVFFIIIGSTFSAIAADTAAPSTPSAAPTVQTDSNGLPIFTIKEENKKFLNIQNGEAFKGVETAPITVVEYSSLSCPHCARFFTDFMPKITESFINSNKVKYARRDFPLNAPAMKATMLVKCQPTEKQERFVKVLFEGQNSWAFGDEFEKELKNLAELGGMSKEDTEKCLANKDIEKQILADLKFANEQLGINSTPSFFINGEKYDFSEMRSYKRIFDKLLKNVKS